MRKLIPLIFCCGTILSCSNTPSANRNAVSQPPPTTNELDRPKVLALARKHLRNNVDVKMVRDSDVGAARHDAMHDLLTRMIDQKILNCELDDSGRGGVPGTFWRNCVPGPNGNLLRVWNTSYLALTIGHMAPTEVTGISNNDTNSAMAELVLTFEPSGDAMKFYNTWRDAFDSQPATHPLGRWVSLRLYDDGWRIGN